MKEEVSYIAFIVIFIVTLLALALIVGCTTTGRNYDKDGNLLGEVEITGPGKAEWVYDKDGNLIGTKVEGKPMLDFSGATTVYERVK